MASDYQEEIRRLSHAGFNQLYRLECMIAIAHSEDGLVCLTDLAKELEVTTSNLQKPLASLVALGLLTRLPNGDSKRRFYMRNASSAWEWVMELEATTGLGDLVIRPGSRAKAVADS